MRRLLSALAVTSCLLTGLPTVSSAQGLPGLHCLAVSEQPAAFRLDFGGQSNGWDRYRLRIPAEAEIGSSQFTITYRTITKAILTPTRLRCALKISAAPR